MLRIRREHYDAYMRTKDSSSGRVRCKQPAPVQEHHFASNKSKAFTPAFQRIAKKYGLDLDEPWNKELLQHQGRHPNEYHEFVLKGMREADSAARGNNARFLQEFELRVKSVVRQNPGMLRKEWWE